MKKSTKLVSAVVVLAVLGGVYVGLNTYVTKEESTESSSEEGSKTEVYSAKTDDIKSLEFIIDKKDTVFEKKDDSWVKKDETAFPVNRQRLIPQPPLWKRWRQTEFLKTWMTSRNMDWILRPIP